MKRTFLRVVSMCLAVILFAGSVNISVFASQLDTGYNTATLQSTVQANVAKSGTTVKTDGEIVVELYSDSLSVSEEKIIASSALIGESYTITTPPESCVDVDADLKKVTAVAYEIDANHSWQPKTVRAYVGGAVVFTADYTAGGVVLDVDTTNYSVEVDYELVIQIDDALERKLLNAPANLAEAIANLNTISGLSANLDVLAENIETLNMFVDGYTVEGQTIKLDAGAATDAIADLYADAKANDGKFTLSTYIEAYQSAPNKVAFLLSDGEDMVAAFDTMHGYFADLCADDSTLNGLDAQIVEAIEKVENGIADASAKITEANDKIADLEANEIADLKEGIKTLEDAILVLNTKIELAPTHPEIESWKQQRDEAQADLDTAKDTLAEANAKIQEAKDAIADAEEKIEKAEDLIETAESYRTMLTLAMTTLETMYVKMDTVNDDYWVAFTDSAVKDDATPDELDALNTLVMEVVNNPAAGKNGHDGDKIATLHNDLVLDAEGYVLTHTITGTVNQCIINVDVVADVYNPTTGNLIRVGAGNADLTLTQDVGVAGSVIKGLIDASNIITTVPEDKGWDEAYGVNTTNYTVTYDIPDSVTENTTCTVLFTPNTFAIDCEYAGVPESAPYGSFIVLPEHADSAKSYFYTVTDAEGTHPGLEQGSTYRIISATSIVREEGMALCDPITIPAFVAGSTIPGSNLKDKDREILKAGGIMGGTIAFGTPTDQDTTVTIKQTATTPKYTYSVTAPSRPTKLALNGGVPVEVTWVPTTAKYSTGTKSFGGANTITIESDVALAGVEVVYTLTIEPSLLSKETVKAYATLANALAWDAASQSKDIVNIKTQLKANETTLSLVGMLESFVALYETEKPAAAVVTRQNYDSLVENCFDNGNLIVLNTFAEYTGTDAEMLAHYYTGNNSELLSAQIEELKHEFTTFIEDTAFLNWIGEQMPQLAGQISKISDYATIIEGFSIESVHSAIDRDSDELLNLAKALLSVDSNAIDEETTKTVADFDTLYYETVITGAAEGFSYLKINVIAKDVPYSTQIAYSVSDVFDATSIGALKNAIKAQMTAAENALGAAKKYYIAPNYNSILPNDGEAAFDYIARIGTAGIVLEYTPISYSFTVEGDNTPIDVEYNGAKTELLLPTPGNENIAYIYTIKGVETDLISFKPENKPEIVTLESLGLDFDTLFGSSTSIVITRKEIDVGEKTFFEFIDALNAVFAACNMDMTITATKDPLNGDYGDYGLVLSVGPGVTGATLNPSAATQLLAALNKYSSVSLNGKAVYVKDPGTIYVQHIIDFLAGSGLSLDTLYNLIDDNGKITPNKALKGLESVRGSLSNVGGLVMSGTMDLGNDVGTTLYITMNGSSEQLLAVKKAIGATKNYVNLSCEQVGENGVFHLTLNMPDKLYPYYMSAMLLLDQTSFEDVQGNIDVRQTMEYYRDLVYSITGDPNFTVETLENTLAELGRTVDLSTYAKTFETIRKLVNYLLEDGHYELSNEVSDSMHYAATVTVPAAPLFNRLPESVEMIKVLIYEGQDASRTLSINYDITLVDRETEYVAMIFDNSESGLGKFYYTTDLTSALKGLGNNSVVVLMADATIDGDVTIPNNAFINLNGFDLTINGKLSTSARVTISDSELNSTGANVGEVKGTLNTASNFIITGGKYDTNVAALLKEGYAQDAQGYVSNIYYSLEKDENGKININIPADILATRTIPEIKALAVDIAFDLAFNVYNAAAMAVDIDKDGDYEKIYSFYTEDLLAFATMSGKEIANELINKVELSNVKALALDIYHQLTDFTGIANKLATDPDNVIVEYALDVDAWGVGFGISEKNTIMAGLVPVDSDFTPTGISISVSGDDTNIIALFREIGSFFDYTVSIDHLSISYDGGVQVDYSGALGVDIDLSYNNNYGALMAAAVAAANGNANVKSALESYLKDGSTKKLAEALENVTLAQFIAGLKYLKYNDCDTILKSLDLPASAGIAELEAIYSDLVYIAGTVLERLDITGGSQKLVGHKVGFSTYAFGPKTYRNIDFSLTIKLLSEDGTVIVIGDPTIDLDVSLDHIIGYKVEGTYLYLDALVDGLTAQELISYLEFTNNNVHAVVTNTVGANNIVATGSVLTVSVGNVIKQYTIVIDGDIDGDGRVTSSDAVLLAMDYVGEKKIATTSAAFKAADVDHDGRILSSDAVRIALKYLHWKAGDDRYVSRLNLEQ